MKFREKIGDRHGERDSQEVLEKMRERGKNLSEWEETGFFQGRRKGNRGNRR
jgi:hypothetical protein